MRPPPSQQSLAIALSPKFLELIILPTEQCNFRCTYCYEDHIPGKMPAGIVGGIKKLIDRRVEDLASLYLSWFGGEPMLGTDIMFDVSEFAHKRCAEKGIAFFGDVTTNGYFLTPKVAARLVAANQKLFFVSLAGVGEEHDRRRPLVSGKGTFDRIWGNLTALKASSVPFSISLRLHYDARIEACETLCRKVNEEFAGDPRFHFSVQRIADMGGEYTGKLSTLGFEQGQPVARHLSSLVTNLRSSHDGTPGGEGFICGAAKPNVLIIRPDGQISKCAGHLSDPKNFVGRLDEEGRLAIDPDRLKPWLTGFDDFDSSMLECPHDSVPADRWPQQVVPARSLVRRLPVRDTVSARASGEH